MSVIFQIFPGLNRYGVAYIISNSAKHTPLEYLYYNIIEE